MLPKRNAPVDALELFERLARLGVPHVNFGMLTQLSAGSQRAAAYVFLGVALSKMSVWGKQLQKQRRCCSRNL